MNPNERIKALRVDCDINQKAVSEYLKIAQTTYSDYETGALRIPIDVLIALARFYNVDMNYISGVSNIKINFPKE